MRREWKREEGKRKRSWKREKGRKEEGERVVEGEWERGGNKEDRCGVLDIRIIMC